MWPLDKALSYKQHKQNTKNLLTKLTTSKWETNANTLRTTQLALCYSIAEYAAPVWASSTYTDILDTKLNKACRAITGCLKLTYVENLYLLAGIALPDTRRVVCAQMEQTNQIEQETYSLFGHIPSIIRLKSRKDFRTSVKSSYFPANVVHNWAWSARMKNQSMGYDCP